MNVYLIVDSASIDVRTSLPAQLSPRINGRSGLSKLGLERLRCSSSRAKSRLQLDRRRP